MVSQAGRRKTLVQVQAKSGCVGKEKASGKGEIKTRERKNVRESNVRASSQRTGSRAHARKMVSHRIDHLSESTIYTLELNWPSQ